MNDLDVLIDMSNDVYSLFKETEDPNARMELKKCEMALRKAFLQMRQIQEWNEGNLSVDEMLSTITEHVARDQKYLRARNSLDEYEIA